MEAALEQAQAALEAGRPALCLALASAAARKAAASRGGGGPSPADPTLRRRALQLQVLSRIHLAQSSGGTRGWWEVLGLEAGAPAAQLRQRFRQLAAAVHPDKCSLPCAAAAFQALQQGVERLLAAGAQGAGEGGGGSASEGRPAKRQRAEGPEQPGGSREEPDGRKIEEEWGDDEEWLASDNGGFPWWDEWDPPAAAQAEGRGGSAPGGGSGSTPGAASPPAAAAGSAQAEAAESPAAADERVLGALPLGSLRAEVARRQAALLGGPGTATEEGGAPLTLAERQAGLRRARTLLARRIQQEEAAAAPAGTRSLEGGFIRGS